MAEGGQGGCVNEEAEGVVEDRYPGPSVGDCYDRSPEEVASGNGEVELGVRGETVDWVSGGGGLGMEELLQAGREGDEVEEE